MQRCASLLVVVFAFFLGSGCAAPRAITTKALLAEMADLNRLTEFPDPPYTCRQFSSYDRASTTPEDPNGWFANGDVNQFLRSEEHAGRKEWVMMDAGGPGAIVRIWSANPAGTLRVYLDHATEPALEVPMKDLLSGKVAGIPEPIAHLRSAGWNSYWPIPYAQHCLVTSDQDGFYYHVNYRTYPKGTPVTTFALRELEALRDDVAAVVTCLAEPERHSVALGVAVPAGATHRTPAGGLQLRPGGTFAAPCARAGGGAIVGLRIRVEADELPVALRHLVLRIKFDDEETVVCPLGDFFGAGPDVKPYTSLPLGIAKDGKMWSDWIMPYRARARIEIRNEWSQPVRLWLTVTEGPRPWTERSMYFHVGWHATRGANTRPFQDWSYVNATGKGVFVGAAFSITNPVKQWWGEGDEKIYVDGEKFPSHFGTGTEDYYGYAWGSPSRFTQAYHNQPQCDGPGNYGRTAVNRWHILDRIPFKKDFRFDMELWHWWMGHLAEFSVVTYWYGRPAATSHEPPLTARDLALTIVPRYVPPHVAGAIEGEDMTIVASAGEATPQDIDGCSNERHLWWRKAQLGDRLILSFSAPAAGRYRVFGRFVKAHDYGIVQISIGEQPTPAPIDLYNPTIVVSDEMLLGDHVLTATDNILRVEIVGANDQAVRENMFGLDYVRLERVD